MVLATKINKNTPFVGLINYKITAAVKNIFFNFLSKYIKKTAVLIELPSAKVFYYRASLNVLPPTNSRKIEFLGISSLSSGIT